MLPIGLLGDGGRAACRQEGRELADIGLRRGGRIAILAATFAIAPSATAAIAVAMPATFAALATLCIERLPVLAGRDRLTLGRHRSGLRVAALVRLTAEARLILLLWRLEALDRLWGGEAIVDWREIVVFVDFNLLVRLIGPELSLRLGRCDDAEIVLRVLQVVFGQHRIARRLGVTRKLEVFLRDVGRVTTHLYVRTVGFEVPAERVDVLAPTIVVTPALTVLVILVWSHWSL
jgi:hypothetical protein